MKETEILKYHKLNELAQTGGIVILGGSEDLNIPLCEIRQAFEMEENWYRQDDKLLGNKEFLVQDPDGYLFRFSEDLGSKDE